MTTVEQVIEHAASLIGKHEVPDGSNRVDGVTDWYGLVGPWCAMSASRAFADAGMPLAFSTSKGFAYCPSGMAGFARQGAWHQGAGGIRRGDVVFYSFGHVRADHVEIVESVSGTTLHTLGGNVANRYDRWIRPASVVLGYGRPAYTLPELPHNPPPPRPTVPERTQVPGTYRHGDTGIGPAILQTRLNNLRGVLILAGREAWGPLDVDGDFGDLTWLSLKAFQKQQGLNPDGIFGPATATALGRVERFLGIRY